MITKVKIYLKASCANTMGAALRSHAAIDVSEFAISTTKDAVLSMKCSVLSLCLP